MTKLCPLGGLSWSSGGSPGGGDETFSAVPENLHQNNLCLEIALWTVVLALLSTLQSIVNTFGFLLPRSVGALKIGGLQNELKKPCTVTLKCKYTGST